MGSPTPHPYYQQLLNWNTNTILPAIPSIATALVNGTLHICADGSYIKETLQGSHAWVFATSKQHIIWKGAGPSVGHSEVMSPYRAELSGLTSVLFLLLWICQNAGVETGSANVYCDNISALDKVFSKERPSNNPLRQLLADIDLCRLEQDGFGTLLCQTCLRRLAERIELLQEYDFHVG